jgi:zinc transport system substrate-binding protein
MSRRLAALLSLVAGIAVIPFGCSGPKDPWPEKPVPRVLASFAPLYCFALNVAGDDAAVRCVMTDTGPHHFDPSPEQAVAVRRADLFFIIGLELDDRIAAKMVKGSRNKSLRIVETADAIPKDMLREGECTCGHEHGDKEKDDPNHHHIDPHVWLGIPQAVKMVGGIRDALKERDPEHAKGYDERAAKYIEKLNKLQDEGKEMLAATKNRKLLTFHDSLRYFAAAFDLELVDAIETAPGAEPDAKKLEELIATAKREHIRVIAVEPQYDSNTSAKVILNALKRAGIDAQLVVVDPLETARPDELNAEFYERKMRENIRNLADKLK